MDAIAQVMQKLPIVAVTDDTGFLDGATQFLDELKDKPAPASPFKKEILDPQPSVGFFSCTRDTSACPAGFDAAGDQVCTPSSSYTGPCMSPIDLSSMNVYAKARWSDSCGASFACSACVHDFSSCPEGWVRSGGDVGFVCQPSAMYVGPCDATDLAGYAAAELEHWASMCGAAWTCSSAL